MGVGGGTALIIIGMFFALGGVAATNFFQQKFDDNQCGNILGQATSGLNQMFGEQNVCNNMHMAITFSQIGQWIGIFMVIGGIIAIAVSVGHKKETGMVEKKCDHDFEQLGITSHVSKNVVMVGYKCKKCGSEFERKEKLG